MAPRGAPRRKEEEQQVLAAIDDNIKTAYSKVRPRTRASKPKPAGGGRSHSGPTYAFVF